MGQAVIVYRVKIGGRLPVGEVTFIILPLSVYQHTRIGYILYTFFLEFSFSSLSGDIFFDFLPCLLKKKLNVKKCFTNIRRKGDLKNEFKTAYVPFSISIDIA